MFTTLRRRVALKIQAHTSKVKVINRGSKVILGAFVILLWPYSCYNGGLWGKFFVFCRIKLKFRFWLYKKRWHTSWKFKLDKPRNKKVITKKPLTNLYEMNSNYRYVQFKIISNCALLLKKRYIVHAYAPFSLFCFHQHIDRIFKAKTIVWVTFLDL